MYTGSSDNLKKNLHSWLAFITIKSSVFKKMDSLVEVIVVEDGRPVPAPGAVSGEAVPKPGLVGGGPPPASGASICLIVRSFQ